jgi:hypothetical protein
VIVIAGGMTSQLTYDGIDVCASRVAWEVSPLPLHTISHIIEHILEWTDDRLIRRLRSWRRRVRKLLDLVWYVPPI